MRLAAYIRVSTQAQAEEDRFGIPRQRHDVARFASAGGHVVVAEFVEIMTGTAGLDRRRAFPDLLSRLEDGDFDGVVLADLTRLSRTLTTQEALLAAVWSRAGHAFTADGREVPTDDPDDPFRAAMRQMAGVFAQLDRAMIAKRLRDGRKAKARTVDSYAWTFAPAGYVKEGSSLVVDPESETWAVVAKAHDLRKQGLTLRAIADVLTTAGTPTPSGRGARWNPVQVSRLLAREPLATSRRS